MYGKYSCICIVYNGSIHTIYTYTIYYANLEYVVEDGLGQRTHVADHTGEHSHRAVARVGQHTYRRCG